MNIPERKYPIAIVKAKVKRRLHAAPGKWDDPVELDQEISRTWLGALFTVGALIGLGSIICLVIVLFRNGPVALIHGWLAALLGG